MKYVGLFVWVWFGLFGASFVLFCGFIVWLGFALYAFFNAFHNVVI